MGHYEIQHMTPTRVLYGKVNKSLNIKMHNTFASVVNGNCKRVTFNLTSVIIIF